MNCYKCKQKLGPKDETCRSCGQEVFTTFSQASKGPSLGRRVDGCLPEEPRPSDYRATPNLTNLPFSVDLRPDCSAVEDQGQVGSCTANAIVGAFEHQQRRDGKPTADYSRLFVYYNARRIGGDLTWDSGARISAGMAALLAFGAPKESSWPYKPDTFNQPPAPEVYQEALSNVPSEYARVDGLDNVKGALARRYPVVFAANLPERCYQAAGETGIAPMPTPDEIKAIGSRHGRHSMLLVGYDQNDGMMIVRNSWGTEWGDRGYFKMAVETFNEVLAPDTTWILGRLDAGDFTIVRPGAAAAAAPQAPTIEGGVKDLAEKIRKEIRDNLTKDVGDSIKDIKDRLKPRGNQ